MFPLVTDISCSRNTAVDRAPYAIISSFLWPLSRVNWGNRAGKFVWRPVDDRLALFVAFRLPSSGWYSSPQQAPRRNPARTLWVSQPAFVWLTPLHRALVKKLFVKRDFRFSWRRVLRWLSSGLFRRVTNSCNWILSTYQFSPIRMERISINI
jgi:hypothetical protein